MKRSLIVCSFLLLSSRLLAQGTFDFLRLDVGARASALNGSFVSMTDDPTLLFYNPAALQSLTVSRGSVGYVSHLLDVSAGHLAYSMPVADFGVIGGGVVLIDYGTTTQTDESGNTLGTFSAREFAFTAGGSMPVSELTSIGVAAKFIFSSLAGYRSSALAADIGVFTSIPSQNITLGASIQNLGTQLSTYAGVREDLPIDFRIGITKRPEHLPVFLNIQFHKLTESGLSFGERFSMFTFGAEFLMSSAVRLRVGYDNEKRKEMKLENSTGLAGFSLGGGIVWREYQFDYAFNSYGKIGGIHRLSLGMAFR